MSFSSSAMRLRHILIGTPYGRYTVGNLAVSSGMWMIRLSTGWLAWELTQSAIWLGILAFADLIPAIICAPVAGVMADRMDRIVLLRRMMVAAIFVSALTALTFYAGLLSIWPLAALTLAQGIVTSLTQPVRLTIVPELVEREDVAPAVAINAISFNIARFIGPMLGGGIIVAGGVGPTFVLNIVLAAVFFQQLRGLTGRREVERASARMVADALVGLRYLVGRGGVLPLFLQAACVGITIRPVAELLPAIAEQMYLGGPGTLTLLTSAMGIGAMLGGIWFAGLSGLSHVIPMIGINGILAAAGTLALVLVPPLNVPDATLLPIGMTAMLFTGFAVTSAGIGTQTTIQLVVEESLRGRIMSSYAMVIRIAPAVGALFLGVLAEWIGVGMAVAFLVPVCATFSVWLLMRRKDIQRSLDAALSEEQVR